MMGLLVISGTPGTMGQQEQYFIIVYIKPIVQLFPVSQRGPLSPTSRENHTCIMTQCARVIMPE